MKKIVITAILCGMVIGSLFIGCSDEKKEQKAASASPKEVKDASGIKVVEGTTKIEKDNPFATYNVQGERTVRAALDGEETNVTRQIGAIASVRHPLENIKKEFMKKKLSLNFIVKCSACHDDYANGIIGPPLLGKSEARIYEMINAYKHKTKVNVLMKELVQNMPEDEIKALAKEIVEFNKEVEVVGKEVKP